MVKPFVLYGSETWAVTEIHVKRLCARERQILRKIHGPVIQQGVSRRRTDHALRELYKYLGIVAGIKKKRFEWIEPIVRMDQKRTVKKIFGREVEELEFLD
jgi:hypothetical protein